MFREFPLLFMLYIDARDSFRSHIIYKRILDRLDSFYDFNFGYKPEIAEKKETDEDDEDE